MGEWKGQNVGVLCDPANDAAVGECKGQGWAYACDRMRDHHTAVGAFCMITCHVTLPAAQARSNGARLPHSTARPAVLHS
mgnify:CR=1 FL=1